MENQPYKLQPDNGTLRLHTEKALTTEKHQRAFILKQLGLMVLLFGLIVLGFESMARAVVLLAHPPESLNRLVDYKIHIALEKSDPERSLIVGFGDSIMDFNFFPELMETRLKQKYYAVEVKNLAFSGGTPWMNYTLLEAMLRRGIKPSVVFYNIHPRLFNQHFVANKSENGDQLFENTYRYRCQLKPQPPPLESALCAAEKVSYFLRQRDYLSKQLKEMGTSLQKPESATKARRREYVETEVSPNGWTVGYQVLSEDALIKQYTTPKYLTYMKRKLGNYEWDAKPVLKIIRLCQQKSIPLVLVWFPEHPYLETLYQTIDLKKIHFSKRFHQLAQDNQVPYIEIQGNTINALDYHDFNHMNAHGAITVTNRLTEVLLRTPIKENLKRQGEV